MPGFFTPSLFPLSRTLFLLFIDLINFQYITIKARQFTTKARFHMEKENLLQNHVAKKVGKRKGGKITNTCVLLKKKRGDCFNKVFFCQKNIKLLLSIHTTALPSLFFLLFSTSFSSWTPRLSSLS